MYEIKQRREQMEREHPGVYAQLLAVDPYGSNAGADWLAKIFLEGNLLLEDLPKAKTYLKLFRENNNHLKHNSLTHYANLPKLFDAVKPYMPKQEVVTEEKPSRPDIITIYEQDGLSVRIPTSESAAQYLGQGTQWCTAYTKSLNHFWTYAVQGPLLHVTTPRANGKEKGRFLLHFECNQFHDEADKAINLAELLDSYPVLKSLLLPYAIDTMRTDEGLDRLMNKVPLCMRTVECYVAAITMVLNHEFSLHSDRIYNIGKFIMSIPADIRNEVLRTAGIEFDDKGFLRLKPKISTTPPLQTVDSVQSNGRLTGSAATPPLPG